MARPRLRFLHKHGLGVRRLEIGDTAAPVYPPGYILPSAAPTGTGQAGDFYFDSTQNQLIFHNGTAFGGSAMPRQIIKAGATTLTAADNGALCIFSAAAGQLMTLPATSIGLWFEFIVDVTCTSSVHRIACPTSSFFIGSVAQASDSPTLFVNRTADGTSHLAWEGNGSTTGGIIGDHMWVTARSATTWEIRGFNTASGTEATPFKTS